VTGIAPIEGHALWADSYDARPNPLLALEARILTGLLGPVDSLRAVDVACGTGRWTERLAREGARVAGVDICRPMLARASSHARLSGRLALADACALPFPSGTADLTLCSFAIGYMADLGAAAAEMARITTAGGRLAISDFHPLAAAAGWTRSFRAAGRVYHIDHFVRSSRQLCHEIRAAGLDLELQVDAHFGEPERAIFLAAGMADRFAVTSSVPAVWISVWKRP
jgi:SAM-dependent methyltransferase